MMISDSADFAGAAWETYATTKSWTLPTGDSAHVVYIKLRDVVLNTSSTAQDSIVIDSVSPVGSIVINSDNTTTAVRAVSLALTATDAASGVAQMMLSEDPAFSGAAWETYSTSKTFTLSTTDGTKTIYAKFRDVAGNVSDVASDSIVLDTVVLAPPIPAPITKTTKTQLGGTSDSSVTGNGTSTGSGGNAASGGSTNDTAGEQGVGGSSSSTTPGTTAAVLTVTFRILDSENQPIPHAKVTLENGMVATTDDNGVVTFVGVEEGSKTLKVEYDNKVDERKVVVSKQSSSVAVTVNGKMTTRGKLIIVGAVAAGVAVGGLGVGLHFARLARMRRRRKVL